ncbi:hypothetical protein J132_00473 [Termitomyces sp. J132]|nr:hypothetical protein J132_00473 [Termitomyces sp. J132]
MDISELPVPIRQRSLSYYLALFCIVVPFCSTIPFAWLYVLYVVGTGTVWYALNLSSTSKLLFPVALCEVLFSIYQYYLWRVVSPPAPYGPGDPGEIQAAFKRLLKSGLTPPTNGGDEGSHRPGSPEEDIVQLEFDDPRAIDFRNALRPWFGNATWSSIKLHQVHQWLYWSIYNADMPSYESLTASQQAVMAGALNLLQKRCGCIFEEGSNPSVEIMRMTLDRANVILRPFTFYLAIFLTNLSLKKWFQYAWSVRFDHHNGLEYLIRIPKHWDPVTGPRPLVFIHGLGVGLLMYSNLFQHLLRQFLDRPILILLQPQITECLANLLIELGWVYHDLTDGNDTEREREIARSLVGKRRKGVTMLSHSKWSVGLASLTPLPSAPGRVMCATTSYIAAPEQQAIEVLMRYFVATEIGVVNLLARHFDWTSNTLWFEEIPNACDPTKSFFLLGGQDSIIHSERVKRYLTSHGVKGGLWYDPVGSHGQALKPGTRGHLEILRWIREEI